MPRTGKRERQLRVALIQHVLTIYRAMIDQCETADLGIIRMAVRLGTYEGRPMDVSSIAHAVGIPRPTVTRHLQQLEAAGVIQRRREGRRAVVYLVDDGDRAMVDDFYNKLHRAVIHTSHDLSNLDTFEDDGTTPTG